MNCRTRESAGLRRRSQVTPTIHSEDQLIVATTLAIENFALDIIHSVRSPFFPISTKASLPCSLSSSTSLSFLFLSNLFNFFILTAPPLHLRYRYAPFLSADDLPLLVASWLSTTQLLHVTTSCDHPILPQVPPPPGPPLPPGTLAASCRVTLLNHLSTLAPAYSVGKQQTLARCRLQ